MIEIVVPKFVFQMMASKYAKVYYFTIMMLFSMLMATSNTDL